MMDDKTNAQFNRNVFVRAIVNFIIPLVCLMLCIILGILVIYPYYKNKPEVEKQIAEKLKLSQDLDKKLVILNKLSDFRSILTESSDLIDKVLVSEANVPQLLDEVYQIATNNGLSVNRLNYSYGEAKPVNAPDTTYEEVNVSLGADGGYEQIVAFLQGVEEAARVLYVPTFRYNVDSEGKIGMSFTVVSPFLYVQSTAVTDEPVALDITDRKFTEFADKLKKLKFYEFLNKDIKVIEEEK